MIEISFVGKTEPDLTEASASVPYEVGIAHYRELARGRINGETYGLLKLLVSPVDRTLLRVHVFGAGATELVHIGQAIMGLGGTIDYLVEVVFNGCCLVGDARPTVGRADEMAMRVRAGVRGAAAA